LIISSLFLILTSCNKDKPFFSETKKFKSNNWNYDERFVVFEKNIEGSATPYEIYLDLDLEKDLEVDEFPITFSIYSDKGEETHKQVVYFFPVVSDNGVAAPKGAKILTKLVYSEKYFNNSGLYTFKILRKHSKYDLYDVKAITLRIVPKKVTK
jgi:hypothetical protein